MDENEGTFRFEEYVEESILKIEDIEQRKILKSTVRQVFLPLYNYIKDEYSKLEERLEQEQSNEMGSYQIRIGIMERAKIDVSETAMVPMLSDDMKETTIDVVALKEEIENQNMFYLFPVFVKLDYQTICKLEYRKEKFKATIKTEHGEYEGTVLLKKNTTYLNLVESLYHAFIANGIPWNTICAPYLYKIFDVMLYSMEAIPKEEILEVKISFEEYEPFIFYHMVPIWNLTRKTEKSSTFPIPCKDKVGYEHIIYKERLDKDKDYLILTDEIPLNYVNRRNEDLVIMCDKEWNDEWELLEFSYEPFEYSKEPIFSNLVKNNTHKRRVRTKGEIQKFLRDLCVLEYLELQEVNVFHEDGKSDVTYSLDSFIQDEIILKENQTVLQLSFKRKEADNYLNEDILSYAISRVQREFPEFRCVGTWS